MYKRREGLSVLQPTPARNQNKRVLYVMLLSKSFLIYNVKLAKVHVDMVLDSIL